MVLLLINGDKCEAPDTISTVSELLIHLGLGEKIVIVELNRIIIEKSGHLTTTVANGDRMEIVHFVGGG
jgi:sulfur carrier protein